MFDDRGRERVLRSKLGARDQPQRFVLADVGAGHPVHHLRASDGERSGLVERDDVDLLRHLERLRALDEDAARRAAAGADHDRRRGREPERARAGDDEHRDERGDGVREVRLGAVDPPRDRRRGRDDEHDRNEDRRDAVDETLDRGLRSLRLLHEAHDLRERGVGADARRAEAQGPAGVDRASRDVVARALFDRDRFAGEHRLVDGGVAGDHETVGRDRLARPHDDDVADLQLVDRHVLFRSPGSPHARRLRAEREQAADRVGGVRASARLEVPADEDQRDDRRGGLVVEVLMRVETGVREDLRQERRDDRDAVGGGRADDDEGVHVRLPVASRAPGVHVERRGGPELHRGGEREAQIRAPRRVGEPADQKIGH